VPITISRAVWTSEPGAGTPDGSKFEVFLHHTVSINKAWTKRQEREHMRQLWHLHTEVNGWADIGYHFVCFPSARIYRARPSNRIPAAQENHNTGTLAIAVAATNPILSLFQRRKLRQLIVKLKEDRPSIKKLGGHRDVTATACPGDRIYAWVVKWRDDFGLGKP
jgi:hypothetical protein